MAELIEKSDSLNRGRVKINESILASERAEQNSSIALSNANEAKELSESTQTQLDTVVINGDSSVEAAQARVDSEGYAFTTLKDRLDSKDTETLQELNYLSDEKLPENAIFKREIFKQLPLRFPDYQTIVDAEGVAYIYPQMFTIDWEEDEIFIYYCPPIGTAIKRWVVVYDLTTLEYKTCFHAGDSGFEGIEVKWENNVRYLYVKSQGTSIGKYDITSLPENLSSIFPLMEYNVGLNSQFTYRNGVWMFGQATPSLGLFNRMNEFSFYNDNFEKIGTFSTDVSVVGLFNSTYESYLPKSQGVAIGDNCIIITVGGIGTKESVTPYGYQGIRVLDMKGSLINEGIANHLKMMDILENRGIVCSRLESEGSHVAPNGEVYSLVVHQDRFMSESLTEGIIIFKEFSKSKDAIDFTPASAIYPNLDIDRISRGIFPINNDGIYNPLNGEKLDTMDKIYDFMIGVNLPYLTFYTSHVAGIIDVDGTTLPSATLMRINNVNNSVFRTEYIKNPIQVFNVYGASGSRMKQIFPFATS